MKQWIFYERYSVLASAAIRSCCWAARSGGHGGLFRVRTVVLVQRHTRLFSSPIRAWKIGRNIQRRRAGANGRTAPDSPRGRLRDCHGVPTSVALGLRFQAGADTVAGQHTIRFQLKQIFGCQVLGAFERPSHQSYSA